MQLIFKDIVSLDSWQVIQNHFSNVLRINLSTLDTEANPLTLPSIVASSYDEVMKSTPEAVTYQRADLRQALESSQSRWREGYQSDLGLYTFFVPLKVKEATLAYFKVGPVILGKYSDSQKYQDTVRSLGIQPADFLDALRQIKVLTFYGIKSIIELLCDIGTCICELNYQNVRLKNLITKSSSALTAQLQPALERVHNIYIDKLLNALLEVCCKFTEADRGSIMLMEKDSDELRIKIAKGLTKEIIKNSRVKVGEGLAGIVVQEKKALCIHGENGDERIRRRCNNPALKHSILTPLKSQDKVLGVLSLATYKEISNTFTSQSVETIDKLTELVESTIASFL